MARRGPSSSKAGGPPANRNTKDLIPGTSRGLRHGPRALHPRRGLVSRPRTLSRRLASSHARSGNGRQSSAFPALPSAPSRTIFVFSARAVGPPIPRRIFPMGKRASLGATPRPPSLSLSPHETPTRRSPGNLCCKGIAQEKRRARAACRYKTGGPSGSGSRVMTP